MNRSVLDKSGSEGPPREEAILVCEYKKVFPIILFLINF